MWQDLIVGLLVVLAALYVLWRLMPGRWRERLGGRPAAVAAATAAVAAAANARTSARVVTAATEPLC